MLIPLLRPSSFENTDLEFQLRQREIKHLVFAELEQSACVESTARVAYERGYTITMLKDATAAFNEGAASESIEKLVWPLFAQGVISTEDWVKSLEN
jgi:nicotinamidase-related amidase